MKNKPSGVADLYICHDIVALLKSHIYEEKQDPHLLQ